MKLNPGDFRKVEMHRLDDNAIKEMREDIRKFKLEIKPINKLELIRTIGVLILIGLQTTIVLHFFGVF